ncbi:helix-turn-helix domain-containing protein [Salipiger aestuarii]|uniref:Helix-turn-helix protein n=1 Tax=Salipiger aestuarii TaxID=568098 RepID=A0A327Y3B5_9RHOB|nr:helix-turn-helix transcriptional regulator [Salipiger aestuarii]KAA8609400.1 DNA-binding protein [Salipiger aestuarii]KAB2541995.1 DNA-binding protein [Salipiger aestuarii]RAK15610.1 helix-turn-helix protein [Salipiger aestuarii]
MPLLDNLKTAEDLRQQIAAAARDRRLALNLTQKALSDRSGVSIATLRRFEGGGPASLETVLALAEALGALDGFGALFPLPEAQTLDDLDAPAPRRRASGRRAQ